MHLQKPRRDRGVILTPQGLKKLQDTKREAELWENDGKRYTLEALSERSGLGTGTIAKVLACEKGVDKQTLDQFFRAFNLELDTSDYGCAQQKGTSIQSRQDWGEAIDVSAFYGRTEELAQLEQWILNDRCRLVALLGMGGMGKTALSVKLAHQIQHRFEYVIWRSLRNAPPLAELLVSLLQFLSSEQETDLPETIDGKISRLLDYLRSSRCLLVLDNVEAILRSGERTGYYREGYQEYGELVKRVGEASHHSCLVLTSREKPKEMAFLEGETLPVRAFQLKGLQELEGQKIFKAKGSFSGSEVEWRVLIERYAGNPLALKIVSTAIQELFEGNISDFLAQGKAVFGDIRDLLAQQFNRLSDVEKELMYWLAINREPVSMPELREDIVSPVSQLQLPGALQSLLRRCLIEKATPKLLEKSVALFTLQSVVMEYVTEQIIEQVCQGIITANIVLFRSHALIKAQAKDYLRDTQTRLILKPIIEQLLQVLGSKSSLENQLQQILSRLQGQAAQKTGYAGGNAINILCQLKTNLSGYDFSHLTVWQAYLQGMNLQQVNFTQANLAKSVFAKTLGAVLSVAFSPNGELLATGDTEGEICFWQTTNGRLLLACKGHTSWVHSVTFSPDGRTLARACHQLSQITVAAR